ncbi:MAG: DUF2267 domain-containing protein [Micromonosporaceae bacterium]|nr:DUF2267 domain-containing protein [Micromonosporaceae bacterium]
MDYDQFVATVARRSGLPKEEAADLARATLRVLSERLSGGEAEDLAAQLPRPLQSWLRTPVEQARRFGLEEFVIRVSDRADLDAITAWTGVRAVLTTVRDAVSGGEFDDIMAQLPREFDEVLQAI